jgi:hypothetical protein
MSYVWGRCEIHTKFAGKLEGKRSLGKSRLKCETTTSIKMDLKK